MATRVDSKSTGSASSSRHRRAALPAALALLGALLAPGTAAAQKVKVAVLPFNGPQGGKVQAEVARLLRRDYELTPMTVWDASARKLVATSRSADDIGAVAGDLGVQVVITGAIKNDGGWTLIVTVRHGPTGKSVQKLKYPLRTSRVDAATLRTLAGDLPPVVDQAVAAPAGHEAEPKEPTGTEPTTATPPESEESPLGKKEPPPPPPAERPVWAPFVDASVGLLLSGRSFAFDQAGLTQFHSTLTPGLRFDVSAYPLAFLAARPGAGMNAVSGLGVGITYDLFFWPDSVVCQKDMAGNCMANNEKYPTGESRFEVGLRWHWNVQAKPAKPELEVSAQYGQHAFSIDKKKDGSDVGPPNVTYSYITLGLGGRLPLASIVAVLAHVNLHVVTDSGDIQSAKEYGPGGSFGFRFDAGVELRVFRGATLRLAGFYERFGLSFDNPNNGTRTTSPCPCGTSGGAADQYYGGLLSVGYVY